MNIVLFVITQYFNNSQMHTVTRYSYIASYVSYILIALTDIYQYLCFYFVKSSDLDIIQKHFSQISVS